MNLSLFKDEQLNHLAEIGNVAQFASFAPNLSSRFSRISEHVPNAKFSSVDRTLEILFASSRDGCVNIRSFVPEQRQGNEFVYGLRDIGSAASAISRIAATGMYVIVNETIDVNDGGVSGVAQGGLYEFAPGATPRIVETGAVATLEEEKARGILSRVYRVDPELPKQTDLRVEFSIHPQKCGVYKSNTLLWEAEQTDVSELRGQLRWPNLFSELIGDKTFGLLVADAYGYEIPRTTVVSRQLPPFTFGELTGESMIWMRTAPRQAEPGLFPTIRGWTDPFKMMQEPSNSNEIASLLIQEEVKSKYSGALVSDTQGDCLIEGVSGFGDDFMLGKLGPVALPDGLIRQLRMIHDDLSEKLGSIRLEWAFDDDKIWVLQLQQVGAMSFGNVIVPGEVHDEIEFDVSRGLEPLRILIKTLDIRTGIRLVGKVGMTSHFADVLRRNRIPSRIT
ncbi:MAG TPA: hypothetical protein VK814_07715 [Acidobacteriaceae bacterium]|nr:hypothetical protein [Acidobacteriaceae bacterium]